MRLKKDDCHKLNGRWYTEHLDPVVKLGFYLKFLKGKKS